MLRIQRQYLLKVSLHGLGAFSRIGFFKFLFALWTLFFFLFCSSAPRKTEKKTQAQAKGIIVNRGLYMINYRVITEEDLANMQTKLRRLGKRSKLKKQALDALIERALVHSEAEKNSIIISEEKIKKEIEKLSLQQGLDSKRFRKKVERELNLPFVEWVKELRYKLIKRQLIQIGLHIETPSLSEVKSFYRKNRHRIGIELRYREMVFIPQSNSMKEEIRVSSIAKTVYNKLLYNSQNFSDLAAKTPHNNSRYKKRGGLVPYQSIYDIASVNPILASILYRHPIGRASRPFRDSLRRYMIVKVESRRPLPLSKVKHMILSQLYAKKEAKLFSKWVAKKKKQSTIVSIR